MDQVAAPSVSGDHWVDVAMLGLSRPLPWSDAGNSTLYECVYQGQPYLFKRYTDEFRREADEAALSRLIAWRHRISAADRQHLDLVAAWPRYRVTESGALLGVLVPIAARQFFQPGEADRPARPRVMTRLIRYRADGQHRPGASLLVKQRALGCAIEVLLWLHSRNVLVNDVHVANILCTEDGHAVYFVDCDVMMSNEWGAVAEPAAPESIRNLVPEASAPTAMTDMARFAWAALWVLMDSFDAQPVSAAHVGRIVARQTAEFLILAGNARRCDPVPVAEWRRLAGLWINDGRFAATARILPPSVASRQSYRAAPGPTRRFPAPPGPRLPHEWVPAPFRHSDPANRRTILRPTNLPASTPRLRRGSGLSPRAVVGIAVGALICLALLVALLQGTVQ